MRLSFVLAAGAWVGLFVAAQVRALPSADFCETHPSSPICGGLAEPSVVDPDLEIAPADPVETVPGVDFVGSFRFKGAGIDRRNQASGILHYDESTFTFVESCMTTTGSVVAKGKKGKKHQLFPDDASLDEWGDAFADGVALLTGEAGAPVGETAKFILKRNADETFSLRIKIQVVLQGIGEVVYTANLTSVAPENAVPITRRCMR